MSVVDGMATRGHQSPPVTAPEPRHCADSPCLLAAAMRLAIRPPTRLSRPVVETNAGAREGRYFAADFVAPVVSEALPGPPSPLRNTARQRCRRDAVSTFNPSARHAVPPSRPGRRPNTTPGVEPGTPFAGPLSPPVASPPQPPAASVAPASVGRATTSSLVSPVVLSFCPSRASRAASVCAASWP